MSDNFELHSILKGDTIEIMDLPLCKLLLCNDSNYPWFILVPQRANIQDIYQLEWDDQIQFLNESSLLSEVLMQVFNGDKMNVAALGNVCPQLHIHHIVRYKHDIAWPKPIWGFEVVKPYDRVAIKAIKSKVKPLLDKILSHG